MKLINFSNKDYGIQKNDLTELAYYNWQYCIQKKIPWVVLKRSIKYTYIQYDLLSIEYGLAFKPGDSNSSSPSIPFQAHWKNIYLHYVEINNIPTKHKKFTSGALNAGFQVLRKDERYILKTLFSAITHYIKNYAYIDPVAKQAYVEIARLREMARVVSKGQ